MRVRVFRQNEAMQNDALPQILMTASRERSERTVQLLDQIHRHVADAHPEIAKKKPTAEELKKAIKPKV